MVMGPPQQSLQQSQRGRSGWSSLGPARPGLGARERSASASKRPRIEVDDDSVHPLDQGPEHAPPTGTGGSGGGGASRGKDRNRSQSRSKQYVVGTLSTKQSSTRKMKSPPADIFIYGVHKDTTEADIVNDLKDSDIIIEEKDIIKKSRPEASLDSYKISVKAEDLQKALNPDIWPLRVKVREFIYYARKPANSQQQGGIRQNHVGEAGGHPPRQGQPPAAASVSQHYQPHGQVSQGAHQMWTGVSTHSRFDVFNQEQVQSQSQP